jgi:LysM repeat protein/ABC-type branched-subunit amino acid transport system substrate-binding protein
LKKFTSLAVIVQLFLLLSLPAVAQFQPTEVIRSQEKTIVNGKLYYIHTVQKGQTLYSISKVYEVTQEEIKTANPQVDVINLREGLAIRIPDSKSKQAAVYPENRKDYYAHSVRRGQTVYSLSKKYNVSEAVIYHYNPWAREGIKPDQTLWIPRNKEMLDISESARVNDLFYYYTTKDKDTLYSISKQYGVNVSDIIDANPTLREGLKPGQVLKIPKIKTPEPELGVIADSAVDLSLPCLVANEPITYEVALMLPFFSSYNQEELEVPADTLAEEGTYVPMQRQQGLRGRNFAEFYEGFMLALDSLKHTGLSVTLHVYDTERDTLITKKIVRELSLIQPDLIIGPVYSEDVNIAGRLARYQEIRLVSPLSTRSSLVAGNTSIIQVIPSRQAESYALANYLKQFNKGRFILIRGADSVSMTNSWRFKKYFIENIPADISGNPLYFKDYKLNDSLLNALGKILSKEEENIIIVFSDHEPDVSKLITRLYMMSSLYPVNLFGMPSWQSWKSIDLDYFHSLQIHLITPFFTDYANPQIKNFLYKSRVIFGYEPYEISPTGYNFSMLGYDIGFYFLSALKQFGKNFLQCIDQVEADHLLTKYHFQKEGNGGYVNNNFNLIQYRKDFTVERSAIVSGESLTPVEVYPAPNYSPDTLPPILPVQQ